MLELFMENWKKEALNYYLELHETYETLKNNSMKSRTFLQDSETEATKKWTEFYNNVSKKDYDILVSKMDRIETIIQKEADKKQKDFIKKVERKAGKILDMSDLKIGKDGSLNGTVKGTNKTVNVETILAGGYNVQILHYRVLVK